MIACVQCGEMFTPTDERKDVCIACWQNSFCYYCEAPIGCDEGWEHPDGLGLVCDECATARERDAEDELCHGPDAPEHVLVGERGRS